MKRLVLALLCTIGTTMTMAAEAADTTRVYYINGEQITRFDGSQLVGALVSNYVISYEKHPSQKGVIVEKHSIATRGKVFSGNPGVIDMKSIITNDSVQNRLFQLKNTETVFIVDGKRVPATEFKSMDPRNIKHAKVLVRGSEGARKLDKDGKQCNYILIETKE